MSPSQVQKSGFAPDPPVWFYRPWRRKRSRITLNIAILQFPHLNNLQSFFLMSTSSRSSPSSGIFGLFCVALRRFGMIRGGGGLEAEVELQTGRLKAS